MTLSILRLSVLLAALTVTNSPLPAAGPDTLPACTSKIRGQFWPEAANTDSVSARAAAQSGELMMCTRQGMLYRWRAVTVHWTSLVKKGTPPSVAGSENTKARKSAL